MSRDEANKIIKMKEERKAARLAATKTTTLITAIGSSNRPSTSAYNKDDDVHSSGNNSGNDSHEEADVDMRSARRPSAGGSDSNTINTSQTSAVELPGYRELLTTRARVDNGFVSGKGQGKAL